MTSRSLSVPRRRDTAGASSGAMPDIGLLYHEHHGWLFNWLRRKLLSPQDAADHAHGGWKIARLEGLLKKSGH